MTLLINLWGNTKTKKLYTLPEVVKREKLQTYKQDYVNLGIDVEQFRKIEKNRVCESKGGFDVELKRPKIVYPKMPDEIKLIWLSKEAIDNWGKNKIPARIFHGNRNRENYYRAFGYSKTLQKYKQWNGGDNGMSISAPCWSNGWRYSVIQYGPIIGYSSSDQQIGKIGYISSVIDYNMGVIKHFCFVTTNATYATSFFKDQINKIEKRSVIIIDEAHNFGATNLSTKLNKKYTL